MDENQFYDKKYVLLGNDLVKFVCFCPLKVNSSALKDGFPMVSEISECLSCSHYLISGVERENEDQYNSFFYCTYKLDTLREDKNHVTQAFKIEEDLVDTIITGVGKTAYFSSYNTYFNMENFQEIKYSHEACLEYIKKNRHLYEYTNIEKPTLENTLLKKNEFQSIYSEIIQSRRVVKISDFLLENDKVYFARNIRKNKSFLILKTDLGYTYAIDYIRDNDYCMNVPLNDQEWILEQVSKENKITMRNRLIWSML